MVLIARLKMKKLFLCLALIITGCAKKEIDKNEDNPEAASVVQLTRKFQHVIRYDCQGKIKSDQIETVASPVFPVQIQPDVSEHLWSSDFLNETTNSSPHCTSGIDTFNVDYSYGWCNMHVVSGVNTISYKFYYCDHIITETDADGNVSNKCADEPDIREEGTALLRIFYAEETLEGTSEVHPDPVSCEATSDSTALSI